MFLRNKFVVYPVLIFALFVLTLYGVFHLLLDVASLAQARSLSGTQTSALYQVGENKTVPTLLNYSSAEYGPLGNRFGTYTMTFSIHITTSAEVLWSETIGEIPIRQGQFSVLLGNTQPLSPTLFSEPNLEIVRIAESASGVVADDPNPRSPIASVPYAYQAYHTQNAEFATHATSLRTSAETQEDTVHVTENGFVAIGPITPEVRLHVQGSQKINGSLTVSNSINGVDIVEVQDKVATLEAQRAQLETLNDRVATLEAQITPTPTPLCLGSVTNSLSFFSFSEDLTESVIREFMETCLVDVDIVLFPWSEYYTKLVTAEAGGALPDVFMLRRSWVEDFTHRGSILGIESSLLPPEARERIIWVGDETMGLFRETDPSIIFVIGGQTQDYESALALIIFLSSH